MVKINTSGQISFIGNYRMDDRNFEVGGRSFYFFDLDDNIFHLDTKIVLFHKTTGNEFEVSTGDFAKIVHSLGKEGTEWEHYQIQDVISCEGSFRNFRDQPGIDVDDQPFIKDLKKALEDPYVDWRGPSWDFFTHAVNNNRPVALITARGHHPYTIQRAFNLLVTSRILDVCPNYLCVYPLSHPDTRKLLGDPEFKLSTAELKKLAIKNAVIDSFACYGKNTAHRYGMSDDDPKNVQLITEAMHELKIEYPQNAFFVINTHERKIIKEEIGTEKTEDYKNSNELDALVQTQLF